jgi:hypothetical protein
MYGMQLSQIVFKTEKLRSLTLKIESVMFRARRYPKTSTTFS